MAARPEKTVVAGKSIYATVTVSFVNLIGRPPAAHGAQFGNRRTSTYS